LYVSVENLNIEKSLIEDLKSDNKNLNKALDDMKLELLVRFIFEILMMNLIN
jgi:hypothetical protein